jgi:hypothetical protein
MNGESRPFDREHETVTLEDDQSRALSARSKVLRERSTEVLARNRRLRERCASLSARIATLVRGGNRTA